ncbi:Proteoglycan-4 [Mactra antiquata]
MNYFISLIFVLFLHDVHSQTYGNNTLCPQLSIYNYPKVVPVGINYRLQLSQPVLIEKILINTTECHVDSLFHGDTTYTIKYIDGSDASYMLRTYNRILHGTMNYDTKIVEIPLPFVMYSELILLYPSEAISCSEVIAQGCSSNEICQPGTCQNGGTCIGNGFCACTKGFIGDNCSEPVDKMTIDDYEPQAVIADILFSQDAAFDITGDVSFTINKKTKRSPPGHHSRDEHHGHHDNSVHIHGHGGSCHYSSTHSTGYTSAGHHTHGHHSSNSPTSAIHGGHEYSHSTHHSHGHGHDHHSHQYLYTTHGHDHHTHGASLHTHDHHLHMHVHDNHHGHHYHVTAPYPSGQTNHIVSSYCPNGGASIIINGNLAAQQTKPTAASSLNQTTTINIPGNLCFGTCGPIQPNGTVNVTMSKMMISGGCVPTMTNNNILGLLGQPMSNFLLQQLLPPLIRQSAVANTTSPTVSTTKATKTTLTTTNKPIHSTKSGKATTTALKASTKSTTIFLATATSKTTTTTKSTTAAKQTTVGLPLLTKAPTTAGLPILTKAPTTAGLPVLTKAPTTAGLPVLTKAPTTAGLPILTKAPTTTLTLPILTKKPTSTTAPNGSATTGTPCQDSSTCASLHGLGSFYNVCADPILSTTSCQKSCNKCP